MPNSVHKGKRGETEFCKWLQKNLSLDFLPERNYNQSQRGSADIISLAGWCFEVKRREILDLDGWWSQCVKSARLHGQGEPVVAFRQNRKPWEFLMSAESIGIEYGFIRIRENIFKEYALNALKGHHQLTEDCI